MAALTGPFWNPVAAEYADVLQEQRRRQKRPCANGCGRQTQSTNGICWECQPSLLDEPVATLQPGEPRQLGPDEDWPEWLL